MIDQKIAKRVYKARGMDAETRMRDSQENVLVGDVVQIHKGAFGAGVVTRIYEQCIGASVELWCIVETVHLSVSTCNESDTYGQLQMGVARCEISCRRALELPVFVTGRSGDVDNRRKSIT